MDFPKFWGNRFKGFDSVGRSQLALHHRLDVWLRVMMMMMMMNGSVVTDIHAVLEVVVFDENPDKKAVFLGKIAIPLLRVSIHPLTNIVSSKFFIVSNNSYNYYV